MGVGEVRVDGEGAVVEGKRLAIVVPAGVKLGEVDVGEGEIGIEIDGAQVMGGALIEAAAGDQLGADGEIGEPVVVGDIERMLKEREGVAPEKCLAVG